MIAPDDSISRKPFHFTITYVLYADVARIFDTLTQREAVATWCEGGGGMNPVPEGEMDWFGGWVKGTVVDADRGNGRLVFTWKPSEWDKKSPESVVRILMKPHPAGTELLLEHGGFPSKEESDKHASVWTDHVFEPLNDLFTGISPLEQP